MVRDYLSFDLAIEQEGDFCCTETIRMEGENVIEGTAKKESITMKELLKLISSQQQEFMIHVEPEEECEDETE